MKPLDGRGGCSNHFLPPLSAPKMGVPRRESSAPVLFGMCEIIPLDNPVDERIVGQGMATPLGSITSKSKISTNERIVGQGIAITSRGVTPRSPLINRISLPQRESSFEESNVYSEELDAEFISEWKAGDTGQRVAQWVEQASLAYYEMQAASEKSREVTAQISTKINAINLPKVARKAELGAFLQASSFEEASKALVVKEEDKDKLKDLFNSFKEVKEQVLNESFSLEMAKEILSSEALVLLVAGKGFKEKSSEEQCVYQAYKSKVIKELAKLPNKEKNKLDWLKAFLRPDDLLFLP